MVKDKIIDAIEVKVCKEMGKVQYHCFRLDEDSRISEYINFPNGEYLYDRYKEFVDTKLTDDMFIPQLKHRYEDLVGVIEEKDLMPYIGKNFRLMVGDDGILTISYYDTETFDEIVSRLYFDILGYAHDCYRKEYLAEHTNVKVFDVKEYYGKWIEDYKPNQFKGIEQGDFIAVKVKYTDSEGGFDIKVGWYDKSINDNGYNIFVSNVDGEYKIAAWCPMAKVK